MGHSEKVLLMRLFLTLLILIFNLQSLTKADDISDFEIEGISVRDSALNFITEEFIKSSTTDNGFYKDKKYFEITFDSKETNYENISLTFKNNDNKYIIYQLAGTIAYDDVNECLVQKKNIVNELSKIFLNAEKVDAGERNYASDPTGESKTYIEYFWIESGGFIEVGCYDLTKKLADEKNWLKTSLNVGIVTQEFSDFLINVHYK